MPLTDEHVLAAYAEGNDLDAVADHLREAFARFAVSGSWPSPEVLVVDERQLPDPEEPEFLPQWDLGLNLGLDHLSRTPDWFAGVEALVVLLRQLATKTERDFVLFFCFQSQPWRQEHLAFIGAGAVDSRWLRGAIERLARAPD